jgi:hypothetical protein
MSIYALKEIVKHEENLLELRKCAYTIKMPKIYFKLE